MNIVIKKYLWLPFQITFYHRLVRLLICFCFISLLLYAIGILLLPSSFTKSIDEFLKQLPTASSILTALVFAIILPKVSELTSKRENELSSFKARARPLTAFRAFVYNYSQIDFFLKSITYQHRQDYLEGYGILDLTGHGQGNSDMIKHFTSEVNEDEGNVICLVAAMRDFTYDPPYGIMSYNPYIDSNYNLKKLQYLQQCAGYIWYFLNNNKDLRDKINSSFGELNRYWKDRMEELVPVFLGPNPKSKEVSLIVSDAASNFEQEIGVMINQLENIIYKWSIYKFMPIVYDTIFIISFGVVVPIISLLFNLDYQYKVFISFFCCAITATFFYSFIYDLYIIFSQDEYKDDYETSEYGLISPPQSGFTPKKSWEQQSGNNKYSGFGNGLP